MSRAIQIHPNDNVAVVIDGAQVGSIVLLDDLRLLARQAIPAGHKVAIRDINQGEAVIKYGHMLGQAIEPIRCGTWVHTHNLKTNLSNLLEYTYTPVEPRPVGITSGMPTFMGYRRANGRVGTRNEVWIVNTVGCVNRSAERIAQLCSERFRGKIDGVYAFSHPYGCSQLGDDLTNTQRVLAGLIRHPNAGGVLVIGLGCENNRMDTLLAMASDVDRNRIRYFQSQLVLDEVEEGVEAVGELVEVMQEDERSVCPVSDLVVGLKCGGSDAFSGITANPLVGRIADRLTGYGGTALLTEVPEMFGAEQQLMNRAVDETVFAQIVNMVNRFKAYFISHDQPIYENPSPGNKEGGLTTLEEKSLGATQKGGQATVTQVLDYGEPVGEGGLALLYAPGNDAVSVTAEVASGATVVLFTTGRGTPLGFPVPTVKISTNTPIFERKPHWIDFNAGSLLDGTVTMEDLTDDLFDFVLRVASGTQRTRNEENDYREIAIWKEGVTL